MCFGVSRWLGWVEWSRLLCLVGRDLFSALIIWGRSSSSFRFWVTEILCLLTDVLVPFKNILKIA